MATNLMKVLHLLDDCLTTCSVLRTKQHNLRLLDHPKCILDLRVFANI